MNPTPIAVFWFRRDLRLNDNTGLYHALKSSYPVLPVFIFDPDILNQFEKPENSQVQFIHKQLQKLNREVRQYGSSIIIDFCKPILFFEKLSKEYNIKAVYTNEDYELSARRRDSEIEKYLISKGIEFHSYKDQVIFGKDDILKDNGTPYTVFTPYSKRWKQKLNSIYLESISVEQLLTNLYKLEKDYIPQLSDLGFKSRNIIIPSDIINDDTIIQYSKLRDYPAIEGTSHLGIHLRFGTISIRQLVSKARMLNDTFLNELIWRDFYHSITYHFPHIGEGKAFRPEYDNIVWRNNEAEFEAWCNGKTGYPLVDAGMKELNETGFMHNRVRMVTASFLTKHLLIDWRWGEAYFANKLLDFDFAANNGGWQWAAGSGCDAVPYFRIFNPLLQSEKFDKDRVYIKKWLPEYNSSPYPNPIVDHQFARQRAIETYRTALKSL